MASATTLQSMKNYSPYQFAFFRIVLGCYLIVHFAALLPYAAEIWSNEGVMPRTDLNLTYGYFPNLLNLFDSLFFVQLFLFFLTLLSGMFLLGIRRQVVSLLLWYGWVCLFDRNNLIGNPGLPFVGWILLSCTVIPGGEPLSLWAKAKSDWEFPKLLFIGAWALMSAGYSISGFDKLNAPSWSDGSAILHLLNNPLARDWALRTFFLSFPETVLQCMTWGILLIELLFLPLAIWNKTRVWIWLLAIAMHIGILLLVDFADMTLGMLMIHWFTFDGAWLKPVKSPESKNIVFFDGICGLCNVFVDFLLREDRSEALLYAPLQGETAKKYLPTSEVNDLKTVIFYRNGKLLTRSDAVIEIFRSMGGIWGFAVILKIIPRQVRDYFYRVVAANRIKWFGQKEICRMPTEKERGRLLD